MLPCWEGKGVYRPSLHEVRETTVAQEAQKKPLQKTSRKPRAGRKDYWLFFI